MAVVQLGMVAVLALGLLLGTSAQAEAAALAYDTYAQPVSAFSMRKVLTAYAGSCLRVRRSSDNTQQDIGFDGSGWIDTSALLAFTGSGSGYVVTWYDQSGNGRDATQATTSKQPRLVNAGVVELMTGGKPGLYFDGTNDGLLTAAVPEATLTQTIVVGHNVANDDGTILSWRAPLDYTKAPLVIYGLIAGNIEAASVTPAVAIIVLDSVATVPVTQDFCAISGINATGYLKLKLDGAAVITAGTGAGVHSQASSAKISLGFDAYTNGDYHRMRLGEAVCWDADLSASWTTMRGVALSGFNLPQAPGQVALDSPVDCPDVGANGLTSDDDIATYGRTLNPRPVLIWNVPSSTGGNLDFEVYLDSGTATTKIADSATSQTGFCTYSGSWNATPPLFPASGVASSVTRVRYRLTSGQALASTGAVVWKVLAKNALGSGVASTTRRFVYANWTWTDPTLTNTVTRIRKVHLDELRTETLYAWRFRHLDHVPALYAAVPTWTDATLTANATLIRAVHLTELRTALTAIDAWEGTGVTIGAEAIVTASTQIKSAHITELRKALDRTP